MRRLVAAPAWVLLGALLLAACAGQDVPTSDVVGTIPWRDSESLSYRLTDKSGAVVGRETLRVQVKGPMTELGQSFTGDPNTDKSVVVADSKTLKPQSATREVVTRQNGEKIEVTYSEQGVLIKQNEKQSGLSVPEHSYDNDSSLFLWRAVTFVEGFKADYYTVVTGSGEQQLVHMEVKRKERITVPAGTFDTWRLQVRAEGVNQVVWYADTPERPLVQYDNSIQLFQLTSLRQ